jgi:hypothetical protein
MRPLSRGALNSSNLIQGEDQSPRCYHNAENASRNGEMFLVGECAKA